MKSPAVNFYTSDFLTGTTFMSNKTVGAYIRILSYQHQLGHLSEEYINKIIYDLDENEKQQLFSKLIKDKKGNYYNERMDNEIFKKQKYSESRANNRKNKITYEKDMNNICKSYDKHMENEIEVVIDNINNNNKEDKDKIIREEKETNIEILNFIENNIRTITSYEYEFINDSIASYGKDIVLYAYQKAFEADKKSIDYVKGILRNWKKNNLTTIEQIKLNENKPKNKKQGVVYELV